MKVVFLSNYFTHHQMPFSTAMYERLGEDYLFIETSEMTEDRKSLGWEMNDIPDYVVSASEYESNKEKIANTINNADVVIFGSAPLRLIQNRLNQKKLTFKYSERVYKKPLKWYEWPLRLPLYFYRYGRHKSLYLLCASAYTASDYAKTFTFINKAYKWGYFPETKKYDDIDELISKKKKNSIMWCGRFIDLKHPEYALELAKKLKENGYSFELNMIGNGELEDEIKNKISEYQLEDYVKLHGAMKPDEVREYMEQSEIFIFTSNKQEGWGAVLNESMNSACAVVANNAIGASPYLINDGVNGLLYYNDKNSNELVEKVKLLLDNAEKRRELSKKAYETIANEWNAENAADKLIILAEKFLRGEKKAKSFSDGVCSNG